MTAKKILFFLAGPAPTVAEQAIIDALDFVTLKEYEVDVRNASQSTIFSDDNLEPCDYVAGEIPTAYAAIPSFGAVYDADNEVPVILISLPSEVSIVGTATKQLQILKITGTGEDDMTITDVTAAVAGTTYASDHTGVATVSNAGLVTGVAAGEFVITFTNVYSESASLAATLNGIVTAA